MTRLYVGNLLYIVTVDEIRKLFEQYGTVESVDLLTEREPGRPHAYAFVEMDDEGARLAINGLDGIDFMGHTLRVEEAEIEE